MSTGNELLRTLVTGLWGVASGLVDPLRSGVDLASLGPDPAFDGTAAQGRVLQALPAVGGDATGPVGMLRGLVADLGDANATPLRGWRSSPDAAGGVALAWRQPQGHLVIGLTPGTGRVDVVASGSFSSGDTAGSGWVAQIDAAIQGTWDVTLTRGEGVTVRSAATGTLTIGLRRTAVTDLGAGRLGGWRTSVVIDAATNTWRAACDLERLEPLIGGGFLGDLLPAVGVRPVSAGLAADAGGGVRFVVSASGAVSVATASQVEAVGVRSLRLLLGAGETLTLDAVTTLDASLAGMPVRVNVDGIGVRLPIVLRADQVGLDAGVARPVLPDAFTVDLNAPPARGRGLIARLRADEWAGLIDLDFGTFKAQGMLVLTAGSAATSSVLVLLSARFSPGLPLGMGITLDGVGGLVGVNRRADADRLRALVQAGQVDHVLFPDQVPNPGKALELVRSVAAAFPAARGSVVVAPMLKLGWAGGLVSVSAAVVLDVAHPERVLLLGRIVVALPNPALPLVLLQASVFGRIDLGVPVLEMLVSLAGSSIVGLPVSGDFYLLIRGGSDPVFVLSAGGFHPRYRPPAGVPALNRLRISLGGGGLGLSLTGYLAITSNSVQFGGEVRLDATIAGCGVEGWLGLDALVRWEPSFFFSVRVRAGVAVKVFGAKLLGVALDFTLEGPAPWHAFGTGEVSLLFFSVALDFDVTWGPGQPPLPPVAGDPVREALATALGRGDAWSVAARPAQATPLRLTARATAAVSAGELILGDAVIRAEQKVLPWNTEVTRFGSRTVAAQTWRFAGAQLGSSPNAPVSGLVRGRFAPGEFRVLTEDEQLGSAAYADFDSGVDFGTTATTAGAAVLVDDRYETGWADGHAPATPSPATPAGWAAERSAIALSKAARLALWTPASGLVGWAVRP